MQEDNFRKLYRKLIAFTLRLFSEYGLPGPNAVLVGTGISAEDLVGKILVEFCEGKIKHHPSRGASLSTLLASAIRNDFFDAIDKASHRKELSMGDDEENREDGPPEMNISFANPSVSVPSVEIDERRYIERVLGLFNDEPELAEVCEAVICLDLRKPAEISECLGIPISEFHNRKKRLRHRLIKDGMSGLNEYGKETKSTRTKK